MTAEATRTTTALTEAQTGAQTLAQAQAQAQSTRPLHAHLMTCALGGMSPGRTLTETVQVEGQEGRGLVSLGS